MKKLLALVLAGVMALSLVACGGDDSQAQDGGESKMKVQLIVSNLGDKSFNDSADLGLKKAQADLGIEYKCVEYGTDNSKATPTIQDAVDDGYNVIVFNNLGYGMATDWLAENAKSYPDVTFLVYDEPSVTLPDTNVQFLCYKANESDFIAGALAAKLSESGVIGFVGGMETPVIQDFLVGYIEGAKYVNPDIKVNISYVGNYADAPKGKELGLTAINAGADVIHAVAGTSGNGALAAAQEMGKLGIGVDSDQYELFKDAQPELAKTIVTSSLKNVGESLYQVLTAMDNGTYEWKEQLWFGASEGCTGIAENENYTALVSEDIRAAIDDIKAKLDDGTIVVSSAYGMSTDEINELVNSVK